MFLFEYIIKLLMGNSNTLFAGLIIVIFGYYGWLLWNIHDELKSFGKIREDDRETLKELRNRVEKLEQTIYRDLTDKINNNLVYIKKNYDKLGGYEFNIDRLEDIIVRAVKEESDEIKEMMKILVGRSSLRKFSLKKCEDEERDGEDTVEDSDNE